MNIKPDYKEKVGFAVGTGRCGTKFLYQVLSKENDIAAIHERNPLNETFHRYCKWYKLPVDDEGFLYTMEQSVKEDLKNHSFSFEASAYLSLSIKELYSRFKSKFILLTRSPERVVNSYLCKGWYNNNFIRVDKTLALGYQKCDYFHHFLGRIVPQGEDYDRWEKMSRIGKLAWYWNILNSRVLDQFSCISDSHWRVVKIEEMTYDKYCEIVRFLGVKSRITKQAFNSISKSRPNALSNVPTISSWSKSEIIEFEAEVKPVAEKLGYEYRVNHIPF